MSCYMCLKDITNGIHIFSVEAKALGICEVIERHFWFKLTEDETTMVCNRCWSKTREFDTFYTKIRYAHLEHMNNLKALEALEASDVTCSQESIELYKYEVKDEPDDPDEKDEPMGKDEQNEKLKPEEKDKQPQDEDSLMEEDDKSRIFDYVLDNVEIIIPDDTTNLENRRKILESAYNDDNNSTKKNNDEEFQAITNDASNSETEQILPTKQTEKLKNNSLSNGKVASLKPISQINNVKCKICGSTNFKDLLSHIKQHHPKPAINNSTTSLKTILAESFFKCTECERIFINIESLNRHRTSMHGKTENFEECSDCGKIFYSKILLEKHQTLHCEGKFTCKVCNKRFRNLSTLNGHIKHCSKEVPEIKNLESKKSCVNYKCANCTRTFSSRIGLVSHIRSFHSNKVLQCPICNISYGTSSKLNEHLVAKHGPATFHRCPECPSVFQNKSDLKNHFTVHRQKLYHMFGGDPERTKVIKLPPNVVSMLELVED